MADVTPQQEPSVAPTPVPPVTQTAAPVEQAAASNVVGDQVKQLFTPAPHQPPVKAEEKLWALVSYIPLMGFFSLLMNPKSSYVKLHARQGLVLTGIFFFSFVIYIVPFIGGPLGFLIQFAALIAGIFSAYQALIGNWWKMPVLGDLADQLPVDFLIGVTKQAITGQPMEQAPTDSNNPTATGDQTPPTPPVSS